MSGKRWHKKNVIRRMRRILKQSAIVDIPNSIYRVRYGEGISKNHVKEQSYE